jgi:hypothetical protein
MIKYYGGNNSYFEKELKKETYKDYKYWVIQYINKNNEYHRLDGPAKEYSDGNKFWYKEGKLHREDGPAKEYSDGNKFWYKEGKLHREDGPAIEYSDGYKEYYYNGEEIEASLDEEYIRHIKLKVFW